MKSDVEKCHFKILLWFDGLAFSFFQIRFSLCHSSWTAGFRERWMPSSRPSSCVPCCFSGSVFIMASGFRWVLCRRCSCCSSTRLSLFLFKKVPFHTLSLCCVFSTEWEEMFDLLPAQARHCWPSVALSSHTRHMANVSRPRFCLFGPVSITGRKPT